MPNGKKHIRINWFALVLINVLVIAFSQDISIKYYFLFNMCFILTSYYISPDLDVDSSVYKRWKLLKIIWWPYREIMKHRQTSHSIIWGPISILTYLGLFIIPLFLLIGINLIVIELMIMMTITIVSICEIHIFADKIF